MKRVYWMIFTVALFALAFGSGCLITDGNSAAGDCCVNYEQCETYCDFTGSCRQNCWFEESCTETCDGDSSTGDDGDAPEFCYNDGDCPGPDICIDNQCKRPDTTERGDAGLCQACETNSNCVDPDALCVRLGDEAGGGETVCSAPCGSGCADGFECVNIAGSSQCLPKVNAQNVRTCADIPTFECVVARDCATGESCVNNKCEAPETAECSANKPCASGEVCRLGECVADDAPECTSRNDCATGQTCDDGECVGGNETCVFNKDCADNAMCVNGTCFSDCSADDQCGRYEYCRQGLCQPQECNGTSDCAGDEVCVAAICEPACEPNTSDEVCADGYLCTDGGFCDRDPNVECRTSAECLRAEICLDGQCESPCDCNTDCGSGEVCNLDQGTCEVPADGGPDTCESICDCVSGEQCVANECVSG